MLKRVRSLFRRRENHLASPGTPRIIHREEHGINPDDISPNALTVTKKLTQAGHEAFLVGGVVRDLLCGIRPKDFDVVTDATPEQVKALFGRDCRLVGRRFRLAHVQFGRGRHQEIIEVSTFRALHDAEAPSHHTRRDSDGMILSDNVWGSIEEDALRRDFTINALYYHPADETILDYTGGVEDIRQQRLQLIGDPETRYQEDPVRMLRAIRFSTKLGWPIAPESAAPIRELAPLLDKVPAARLFDEVLKLLLTEQSEAAFQQLLDYGLFQVMFPGPGTLLDQPHWHQLIQIACRNTAERIRLQKGVTPAFIYAVILWPSVSTHKDRLIEKGMPPYPALQKAANQVLEQQLPHVMIPRRFTIMMREIWTLQLQLPNRAGKRAERLAQHPRFRAGYDFLLLREASGELPDHTLGDWWTRYQEASPEQQQDMANKVGGPGRKRRPRKRKRPSGQNRNNRS